MTDAEIQAFGQWFNENGFKLKQSLAEQLSNPPLARGVSHQDSDRVRSMICISYQAVLQQVQAGNANFGTMRDCVNAFIDSAGAAGAPLARAELDQCLAIRHLLTAPAPRQYLDLVQVHFPGDDILPWQVVLYAMFKDCPNWGIPLFVEVFNLRAQNAFSFLQHAEITLDEAVALARAVFGRLNLADHGASSLQLQHRHADRLLESVFGQFAAVMVALKSSSVISQGYIEQLAKDKVGQDAKDEVLRHRGRHRGRAFFLEQQLRRRGRAVLRTTTC